jgi:NAD(P)-dependent dehydrogenase (short-subunit alcohol dehydrogenase family)
MNHALIIGGSRGLGKETVDAYSRAGWSVSSVSRGEQSFPPATSVTPWKADISKQTDVQNVIPSIISSSGDPKAVIVCQRFRSEQEDWDGELQSSITGVKYVMDALCEIPTFIDSSVVFVSSVNAKLISRQVSLSYHVAKAALNQMVRYYAVKLGTRGIRVNSVSPGTFVKPSTKEAYQNNSELGELMREVIPLGRLCEASEVISTIMFLTSAASSFITAQDIVIDGGVGALYPEALARELFSL